MNKVSKINFFSNIQNLIKENIKNIIFIIVGLFVLFVIYQIYFFYENKKILKLSLKYTETKILESQSEFIEKMSIIAKDKNFYGLLASLEIINVKIKNKNFIDAYSDYLELLDTKNINNIYKTLLAIHGSYNLLDKMDYEKILNLLSYVDKSLESFEGYHLEILYLLSLKQGNTVDAQNLYNQIFENNNVNSVIKERVKKINEFNKYK